MTEFILSYVPIGDLTYDADIGDIIMMVKAYHLPDDVLTQSALFNYYVGKILYYWSSTKDYVNSDEIETDQKKITYGLNFQGYEIDVKSVRDNLLEYEKLVLEQLSKLEQEFKLNPKCNMSDILTIFSFIAEVGCAHTKFYRYITTYRRALTFMAGQYYGSDRRFLLPNLIGVYGVNTYVYALLHGIHVLGVPLKLSEFDRNFGCPWQFLAHDIQHSDSIDRYSNPNFWQIRDRIKTIYDLVLHDPNLSDLQKQCIILWMWIDLHENRDLKFYQDGTINLIKVDSGVSDFVIQEDRKFTDFTGGPDSFPEIQAFIDANPDRFRFISQIPTYFASQWYARKYLSGIIRSLP